MPIQDADQYGAFVQTTQVWDIELLQDMNVNSSEFKELLVRLYQQLNNIALVLNIKDTGKYDTQEYVNGQVYFPNPALSSATAQVPQERQVLRKVLNVGPLTITGVNTFAPGITCTTQTTFTRIYGVAKQDNCTPFGYLPITVRYNDCLTTHWPNSAEC